VVVVQSASQTVTVKAGLGATNASITSTQYQDITPPVSITTTSRVVEIDIAPSAKVVTMSNLVTTRTSRSYQTALSSVKSFVTTGSLKQLEIDIQSITSKISTHSTKLEVLFIPPPTGIVDGYEELLYWTDPIPQRSGSFVTLDNSIYGRHVVRRGGLIVQVKNISNTDNYYIGTYEKTNVGYTIGHFNGIFGDGTCDVSAITLEEIDRYYPTLTLSDFDLRSKSSYTTSGDYFNLVPPSIQNPIAVSSSSGTIPATINVAKTTYFPSSGYIYHSDGTVFGVIQYTGKTTTSFTGCTRYSGSTTISSGALIIPFEIT
jgi:hypothetical protein